MAKAEKQEIESLVLIQSRLRCAQQALQAYPRMVDGYTVEELKAFTQAAIASFAEAVFLERMWWIDANVRHGKAGSIDFETGELS